MSDTFNIDYLKSLRVEQHPITDRHVLLSEGQWEQVIKRIAELEAEVKRLREALEIIAGKRQCINNLMSNVEIAEAALLGGGE